MTAELQQAIKNYDESKIEAERLQREKEEADFEEYKKQVKKDLETSNQETADTELEQKVWAALIENCVIDKYPEDKLQETISGIESEVSYVASMYNMSPSDFIKQYYGITSEEMAKNLIKQEYAIELIVEKEKMKLSNEDYEKGNQLFERFLHGDSFVESLTKYTRFGIRGEFRSWLKSLKAITGDYGYRLELFCDNGALVTPNNTASNSLKHSSSFSL